MYGWIGVGTDGCMDVCMYVCETLLKRARTEARAKRATAPPAPRGPKASNTSKLHTQPGPKPEAP